LGSVTVDKQAKVNELQNAIAKIRLKQMKLALPMVKLKINYN
jgi:hypothetical protein